MEHWVCDIIQINIHIYGCVVAWYEILYGPTF